ncbi:MAG: hypothetical protein IPH97_16925 [Ignavibacteriales bacterium]|nr:hypothetical protein [Ignavibacteriales bacterium]
MSFKDIIHIIIFNKLKIIKITFFSTLVLFLTLLFVYPVTYNSTVSILPPEKNNDMGGLSSLLSGSDFSSILKGGLSSANSQLFVEILKSRTASLYVVEKLNLVDFLDANNKYDAAEKLNKKIYTELNKEGIVKLSVDIRSSIIPSLFSDSKYLKNLSAKVSNTFVEALDNINRAKLSSKAKNARIYIEKQLEITKKNLDSAETALMFFQQKNKTIDLPEQVNAAIDAATQLRSEIFRTEIELGLLKNSIQEDSKTYISFRNKLQTLNNQYSKLEMGNEDYMIAFSDVPNLGKELAGLVREVKIQNEVYILLQQQYFKERIQENRDLPTIETLDEAIVPQIPSSPRTIYSTFLGFLFFFLFTSLLFVINDKKFYNVQKNQSTV